MPKPPMYTSDGEPNFIQLQEWEEGKDDSDKYDQECEESYFNDDSERGKE